MAKAETRATSGAATTGAPVLGIDIGGTGIKGAPVDVVSGALAHERLRIETPQPADVEHVTATVAEIAKNFPGTGPIGVTFPAVVVGGIVKTAANVDQSWIGTDAASVFGKAVGREVLVLNDADAAGVAELTFGAGKGQAGVTILLTFGTGIGSAVFLDGKLVPNTELGHLEWHGEDAELRASEHAREEDDLSWKKWAHRIEGYLEYLERILQPDLFIIGGGASNKGDKLLPLIDVHTRVVTAALHNDAGIVGAALAASQPHAR